MLRVILKGDAFVDADGRLQRDSGTYLYFRAGMGYQRSRPFHRIVAVCRHDLGIISFLQQEKLHTLQASQFQTPEKIILNIFGVGMSPFVMNVCACCIVIFINNRLLTYGGDLSIGAFGILNRIQMLFVMIVMGITMGMQPISGYNYGAQHYDRVKRTLQLGIIAGCSVTTVGFLVSELFPSVFVGMFTTNHELTEQATLALRIGVLAFPVIGAQIIITQFFQSIGKVRISILLSLSRQLVFLLPGLALLPPHFGVEGVWFSMPLSDTLAFIMAVVMLIYHFRKLKPVQPAQASY